MPRLKPFVVGCITTVWVACDPQPASQPAAAPPKRLGLNTLTASDFTFDSGQSCATTSGGSMVFTLSNGCSPRIKSSKTFSKGRFSASIKPPKGTVPGAVTSFYMSSGEGSAGHSEVDFEFLGNRPNGVQLNLFVNGVSKGGIWRDLPFNAGDAAHEYTIDLTGDSVTWSVDGSKIYSQSSADQPMPNKPMMIYSSIWNAGDMLPGWAGSMDWSKGPYSYSLDNIRADGS